MLNSANTAMHRAKEKGHNTFQFYTRKMTAMELQRLVLQTSLHHALERGEFRLHYQPQVDVITGRLMSTEALVRWEHPEFGLLKPEQFIPLAEETGLIIPLGKWVLMTACRQCSAWNAEGLPPIRVAVNISPRQFRDPALGSTISTILLESNLAPEFLELELTESTLMDDTEASHTALQRFRSMGVHVCIDDFGTGYSSLSYLKRFPLDALKIDQSFVQDIPTDPDDSAIARAVIGLAHNLRLRVIAEGVESSEQLEFLRTQGCDAIQGDVYSPAIVAGALADLLRVGTPIRSRGP